ncbi:MAG: DNA mismatch repair endonuclease MutL [Acholeplasmataceae bacterium]
MNKIKKMSDALSNMIAAGEVVERPANVVKELVENALDAQATHIKISLKDQGLTEVSVDDDGIGMSYEDANLACVRHATSKLYEAKDLQRIASLGFRGEALAAIASVSRIDIQTKEASSDAIQLTYEGGLLIDDTTIARNTGTKVIVTSLFYNTPARFKFLSSDYQHQRQLRQLFYQLALSHPHIAFTLMEDETIFKQTTGSGQVTTLMHELFGQTYSKDLIHIESDVQHTHMSLYFLPPDVNVSHKQFMYTFINQRYVKHFAVQEGIMNGFDGLLMVKRYPICLAYITIDPSRVDVNIHPQKLQVKLANEQVIKYHIESHIKNYFQTKPRQIVKPLEQTLSYDIQSLDFQHIFEDDQKEILPGQKLPELYYLNMLAGTYGLFQHDHGLALLDVHAAQERIRYEYYVSQFEKDFHITTERIVPYPLSFDETTRDDILSLNHVYESFGFTINETGVIKHPKAIRDTDLELAVEHIFEAHHQGTQVNLAHLKDLLAKDVSCKGSIKANQRINEAEMVSLYNQLKACDMPYSCPHGRPTIIMLTYYDIEKMFKRVVS